MKVAQVLIKAKSNGIPIFNGMEQGSGKNQTKTYIYFKPNMKTEEYNQIRKFYRKQFTVEGKDTYETSLPIYNAEDTKMNSEIQDYILDRLKEV